MRIFVYTFRLIVIALVLCIVLFAGYYFNNKSKIILNSKQDLNTSSLEDKLAKAQTEQRWLRIIKPNSTVTNNLDVSGWIPDWDLAQSVDSFVSQAQSFDSISPVYYFINPDGSLKPAINLNSNSNKNLLEAASKNNVKIIPAIQDFSPDNMSLVLSSSENIMRHNQQIEEFLTDSVYAGIDLDYEATYLKDQEAFFTMLTDLRARTTKLNKMLVFTVLPKWGNYVNYQYLPQTRQVQDWSRIAPLVDELRIMTYQLYGGGSIIGPIAPLDWMELNIKYALTEGVPRSKIMLGVHTYSYDWSERDIARSWNYLNHDNGYNQVADLPQGLAYYNTGINKIKKDYVFKYEYNALWGEAIGTYKVDNKTRTVIFPTQQSLEDRKKLAQSYGIKGVAYWRIGDEEELKY